MGRLALLLVVGLSVGLSAACSGGKQDEGSGNSRRTAVERGRSEGKGGGAAIDEARARELSSIDVPGFTRTSSRATKTMALPSYEADTAAASGKRAHVDVMAQACVACLPMDVDKWRANDNLKSSLPKIHKENPNLVWEVAEIEAGGIEAISIYKLSFASTDDGKSRGAAHGVRVHYNNGVNQLMLTVSARGGSMASSAEELAAQFSKEEFMAVAKKFLAAFGPRI